MKISSSPPAPQMKGPFCKDPLKTEPSTQRRLAITHLEEKKNRWGKPVQLLSAVRWV